MSTAQVFNSGRDRPVALRRRPDLVVAEQVQRNERFYLIKDPLEMEFYRLNEEEYAILQWLDGSRSLEEIKELFERKFPPQRVTAKQLQSFVSDLHKKSLLAYSGETAGAQLVVREREKSWEKLKKNLGNIFTIKWRGVDPDRLLDFLLPIFGWIFSPLAVLCAACLMAFAGLWLLVHLDVFFARLPALQDFLAPRNWATLLAVVVVMKVVHEFAHGLTFKRFGGECHEIGVMFLLFIPTMYCGTTDSWLLRSKWQRAAIGAAGMYIELLTAALATFGWWFSEPGTFNSICLNIMATGTLSTVVFNGNPFLKYDGYYIFSDLFELPNLRERAARLTQTYFLKYGLGIDEEAEQNSLPGTKLTLLLYQAASYLFRVVFLVMVNFTMLDRMKPIGLQYFGLMLGLAGVAALIVPGLWGLYKFFEVPGKLQRIKMKHALMVAVVIAGGAFAFCGVPFPHYVTCAFVIQPRNAENIYVKHDANLKAVHVAPCQEVEPGDLIAEVEDLNTLLELSRLKTELAEFQSELSLLERTRLPSTEATGRIADLRQSIATNLASTKKYEQIAASFRIVAGRAGQVIPEWKNVRLDSDEELHSWSGSPLSEENIGTRLTAGQKICTIGRLDDLEAILAANEHDVELITAGQTATLMLDARPDDRIAGKVQQIARKQAENLPESLSQKNGGDIQIKPPAKSQTKENQPTNEHFEVRVPLDSVKGLSSGLRGQAQVYVGSKTAFERLQIIVYRTFAKKL